MPTDTRIFIIALAASLSLHGAILLPGFGSSLFFLPKKEQKIEVSYLKNPQGQKAIQKVVPQYKDRQGFLPLPAKITVNDRLPPKYGGEERESIFKANKEMLAADNLFAKPAFIAPAGSIAVRKKISLPPVDLDKINSPSYISYYQIVREKIRRAAYQNYARTETGEAYLSFMISSDGALKEVRLVDEKSSLSPYLRGIALKSIQEATPFPNFPKELDYPQLSFNVIISFEIE